MASIRKLDQLTEAESADLRARVDQFRAAWTQDRSTKLAAFLPSAGKRHQALVFIEILTFVMEQRAQEGLPIRIEEDLAPFYRVSRLPDAVLLPLLAEEYALRHRYLDRPTLDEYRRRFPTLAGALWELLQMAPGRLPPGFESETLDPEPTNQIDKPAIDSQKTQVAPFGETQQAARIGSTPEGKTVGAPSEPFPVAPQDARMEEQTQPAPGGLPPGQDAQDKSIIIPDAEYKLIRLLGKGAYGEVWEGIAPGGYRVAVKLISRSVDDPATQQDIKALQTMQALAHPFMVQTHAYWVRQDRLVIAMDLADGALAGRIKYYTEQGKPGMPPDELIPYIEQVAEVLDYMHKKKVSHGDVKPENLLLHEGYAKVADFGLARPQSCTLTGADGRGTPLYMAPEVWAGKMSFRSDQYSLAATYIVSRINRPPFLGKTLFELCEQHCNGTPGLDPLPSAEKQVLLKALAKKPEDRYPTCGAFAKALRQAVLPPPAPATGPPRPIWRRLIPWVIVAATLLIVIAIGLRGRWPWEPDPSLRVPPLEPECPPDWEPEPGARLVCLVRGREPFEEWEPGAGAKLVSPSYSRTYYKRVTREVAGEKLVAILVAWKDRGPADPEPFYMLKNKLTHRVFKKVWEDAKSELNPGRGLFSKKDERNDPLFPGDWEHGVGEPGIPVVRVTAIEAMFVARKLGGLLPTYDQWRKAVGGPEIDQRPGPAGPEARPGEELETRPLALGLRNGPWPVTKETKDLSLYGIHQLVSNGYEWTDGDNEAQRINPDGAPGLPRPCRLTGRSWTSTHVLTFQRIANDNKQEVDWNDTKYHIGFRIILKLP